MCRLLRTRVSILAAAELPPEQSYTPLRKKRSEVVKMHITDPGS